ncbi:MAG: TetR/AcrR family transcriptional regulator [Fidelibacterota bacterium]
MKRNNKKLEIEEVALQLFSEKGIKGTSTRDIAGSIGISEGTIYRHFKSKDDLAYQLFLKCVEKFSRILQGRVDRFTDPLGKLTAVIDGFITFAFDDPLNFNYLMRLHHSEIPEFPDTVCLPRDIVTEVIVEGIKRGVFRDTDPNLLTAQVVGSVIRSIYYAQQGFINISGEDFERELKLSAISIVKNRKGLLNDQMDSQ